MKKADHSAFLKEKGRLTINKNFRANKMKKLFVGGLNFKTTEESLRDAFSKAGEVVSAVVIMDRMTGRSKGFGFVEMANDDEADKAIEMYNNQEMDGRKVVVNEARPLEKRF